ncbi:MAG: hypothetical protein WA667_09830 [Candidatus Nitrosopolaris sp.]
MVGNIPFAVNKHFLVIVDSISGNTREVISNMEEATERNVVCISSGGELKNKLQIMVTSTHQYSEFVAFLSDNARTQTD